MSDDSDAEFMSFASAPGPSSVTEVTVYASPDDKRQRRSHKKRRKDESRERSSRHRSTHREERKAITQSPKTVDLWGQLLEAGILVDRRGDSNLLMFKETSKSTAPKFVRRGGHRVLGLSGSLRVESDDGQRINLVRSLDKPKRYMDVDWASQRHAVEHIEPLSESTLSVESADFISLAESTIHGVGAVSKIYDSDAGDGPSAQPDFRSIEGRAKDPPASSTPAQVAEDQPIVRSEAQLKMIELERQVRANPHDISAWQSLAQLQEHLVASAFAGERRRSKRTIAESQIAVYKRALQHNSESRPLVLGYLSQCRAILDDAALADEWEQVLESTGDPEVITRYVAAHQTMTQFSVPKVMAAYVKGIRRLQRVLRDRIGTHDSMVQGLLRALVELVHCVCLFLRETGYAERAVAVYQAVVEWYVLTPERLWASPYSHRKNAFEQFWDSGVPRIGMAGASGWCCYDNTSTGSTSDLGSNVDNESLESDLNPWAVWCRAEHKLAEQSALPVVFPMAQLELLISSGTDLHSLVVFEDVESFIVDLPWDESTAGLLLDRYMQFLGVVGPRTFILSSQPPPSSQGNESLPALDDFMWTVPGSAGSCESMFASVREMTLWDQVGNKRRFPFVSIPVTLDTCDTPLPYAYSCPWMWQSSQKYLDLASQSFELLSTTPGLRLTSRMRLLLATAEMEWSFGLPSSGTSVAKRLLKAFPTCFALWNTYAKLHARYGRWDEARNIWATILVQTVGEAWAVVVRKSWAVLEITHGRGVSAGVRIMAATVDGCTPQQLLQRLFESDAVSAVDMLCARKLADSADLGVYDAEVVHARLALRMWLAYAAERSCDTATLVYKEWADTLDTDLMCIQAEELATLELCSIHLFHSVTSKVYRAWDLRSHLERAVNRYPHTTVFWEMYICCESRSKIFGRVSRQISAALACEPQAPDLQLLGLYEALSGGAYDQVRGALKRATRRDAECWSPLIWMTCIVSGGSTARAKRLLLGAMPRCPWLKPLYMSALGGELAVLFGDDEKKGILRALVFLGLRTRALLADDL
ncbi:hypothetical protein GGI09_005576 [Coemansia sp. S100]|nr:hypothetical protein LPJ71_001545 [Coemansia sp. S17]KAJ2094129.1 hypothetical protein GGI09_005576 [Coemansia sp. S100]KAJ2099830.1 hypothetical protein GGI16_003884 [Coemansia sp. S142-1]